jgi:hypothetical protein
MVEIHKSSNSNVENLDLNVILIDPYHTMIPA